MAPVRSGIFSIFVLFYSVFLHAPVFAQNPPDNVAITPRHVNGTVHLLTVQGGNAPAFLLNTHFHGDHSGDNEAFAAAATIIAHHNVRSNIFTENP